MKEDKHLTKTNTVNTYEICILVSTNVITLFMFQPMRIHTSQTFRESLQEFPYEFEERGQVDVKVYTGVN